MPVLRDINGRILPGSAPLARTGRGTSLMVKAREATMDGDELIKFWIRVMRGDILYTVIRTTPKGDEYELPVTPTVGDMLRASENLRNAGYGTPMSSDTILKGDAAGEGIEVSGFTDLTLEERLLLREQIRAERTKRLRPGTESVDLARQSD